MEKFLMTANNCEQLIKETILNQRECLIYGITDKSLVLLGDSDLYNKNYIIENSIITPKIPNVGGVMVLSVGDIEIAHFSLNTNNKYNENLSTKLITYLTQKGINAKLLNNDIIVDDIYKCGSCSTKCFDNLLYSAFHISINCNLELIKNICIKPMVKIPKGLSEYGITTQEIIKLIEIERENP